MRLIRPAVISLVFAAVVRRSGEVCSPADFAPNSLAQVLRLIT